VLLGSSALALAAVLGTVWLSRARAARRLHAAVAAYAEQEIAREQARRPRGVSARGGAPPAGSTGGR
jgi:hypothetical protein